MEVEFFTAPTDAQAWFSHWVEASWDWYLDLGIDPANLRRVDVPDGDRAHYSAATVDVEYRFVCGQEWGELMESRTAATTTSRVTARRRGRA